jgi:dihydroxyacetone kinase-like predicted kinase
LAGNWKRHFNEADNERRVLSDVRNAIRSGQVDTVLGNANNQRNFLRLFDSDLVAKNEKLLEELEQQSKSLVRQNSKLEIAHLEQQRSEKTVNALMDSQLDALCTICHQSHCAKTEGYG